jgi:solute carrier family 25 iron transporter 28/37
MYVALPATLIMNLPYGMIMVATNESCRKWLNPTDGHVSISTSLIAGSIAGGVAAALTTPLDTLKTRLQTNDLTPIMGEGGMRLGHAPSSANYVGGVTVTQTRNIASAPRVRKPTPSTNAVAWLYQSTAQAARKIWREAGIQGYFRGVVPRVLTHSPSVAISWTTYEAAKSFILR